MTEQNTTLTQEELDAMEEAAYRRHCRIVSDRVIYQAISPTAFTVTDPLTGFNLTVKATEDGATFDDGPVFRTVKDAGNEAVKKLASMIFQDKEAKNKAALYVGEFLASKKASNTVLNPAIGPGQSS